MGGQVLDDADLLQHNDLGNKRDSLQPQGEGPYDFPGSSSGVAESSQDSSRGQKDFPMRELVAKCVVGGAEGLLGSHKVNNQGSGGDEEDLHEGVVDADEVHEEVHVSHAEDQQIDFLGFTRETCTQS